MKLNRHFWTMSPSRLSGSNWAKTKFPCLDQEAVPKATDCRCHVWLPRAVARENVLRNQALLKRKSVQRPFIEPSIKFLPLIKLETESFVSGCQGTLPGKRKKGINGQARYPTLFHYPFPSPPFNLPQTPPLPPTSFLLQASSGGVNVYVCACEIETERERETDRQRKSGGRTR